MRKTLMLLLATGLMAVLAGCGTAVNTGPTEKALVYQGGSWTGEAKKFKACIPPSSGRKRFGQGDKAYTYQADQRTFDFTGGKNADSDPITVVSKDGIEMQVAGVATFTLNTDCDVLQEFNNRIGLKFAAYSDGEDDYSDDKGQGVNVSKGWERVLQVYFKNPLDRAMDQAAQEYDWFALYNDPTTKTAWQDKVAKSAPVFIKDQAGGNYFCGPTYAPGAKSEKGCGNISLTIQKPKPPQGLVDALNAKQAATQRSNAIVNEQQAIQNLVKVLGSNNYILYQWQKQVELALKEGRNPPPPPIFPGTGLTSIK